MTIVHLIKGANANILSSIINQYICQLLKQIRFLVCLKELPIQLLKVPQINEK